MKKVFSEMKLFLLCLFMSAFILCGCSDQTDDYDSDIYSEDTRSEHKHSKESLHENSQSAQIHDDQMFSTEDFEV